MDISDFPTIIEELPIAVVVVDGDGEVVIANRAARRYTACPAVTRPVRQQAVDHALREIGTGRPLAVEESPLGRALAGQVVRGFEYVLRWPGSAEDVWMAVDACPMTDSDGRVRGAIAVIADSPRSGSPGPRAAGSLSDREAEVLRLLAGGQTNRQLAAILGVSENTAKKYVSDLMHRHGLSRRSEAAGLLRLWDRGPTQGRLDERTAALSEQERRILGQIARGKTNQEIARALALSPHTIKTYVSVIFQKLHVTRRAEAAALAVGLLPAPDEA